MLSYSYGYYSVFCFYVVMSQGSSLNQFQIFSENLGFDQATELVCRSKARFSVYLVLNLMRGVGFRRRFNAKCDLFSIQFNFFIYCSCLRFISCTIFSCLLIFQLLRRDSISMVFSCWSGLQTRLCCTFILDQKLFNGDEADARDKPNYILGGGFRNQQSIFLSLYISYCFLLISCFSFSPSQLVRLLLALAFNVSEYLLRLDSRSFGICQTECYFRRSSLLTENTVGVSVNLFSSLEYALAAFSFTAWMAFENRDDKAGCYGLVGRAGFEEVWLILNLLLPLIIYYYQPNGAMCN